MEKLRQEKKTIADELLASKEKLISLEGLNEKLLAQQVNTKYLSRENSFVSKLFYAVVYNFLLIKLFISEIGQH